MTTKYLINAESDTTNFEAGEVIFYSGALGDFLYCIIDRQIDIW